MKSAYHDKFSDESEDDLASIDQKALQGAVVFGTDWTAETIISQLRKGTISLSPKFQRRDAWTKAHKSRFIESLLLGIPIPQLVLAEDRKKKGHFLVIDGKQRLLALSQFAGIDKDEAPLKLVDLLVLKSLNGSTYEDFEQGTADSDLSSSFDNAPIRTIVIRNWKTEDVLYLIFHRLNTGSVRLSPQELRQALHPGPFLDFAFQYSAKSEGLKRVLKLKEPDFRMRDVELLLRFYAYHDFLSVYDGDLKHFLDLTCTRLNKNWKTKGTEAKALAIDFERSIAFTYRVFGQDAFRKWDGTKFEPPFNRAVFDIMTYFFSSRAVRKASLSHGKTIKESFKELCDGESAFRRSIESTTKSLDANRTRFGLWAASLSEVTGVTVDSPQIGK